MFKIIAKISGGISDFYSYLKPSILQLDQLLEGGGFEKINLFIEKATMTDIKFKIVLIELESQKSAW